MMVTITIRPTDTLANHHTKFDTGRCPVSDGLWRLVPKNANLSYEFLTNGLRKNANLSYEFVRQTKREH